MVVPRDLVSPKMLPSTMGEKTGHRQGGHEEGGRKEGSETGVEEWKRRGRRVEPPLEGMAGGGL